MSGAGEQFAHYCERVAPLTDLNGDLGKPSWERAAKVELVDVWGNRPQQKTLFQTVHDGSTLYVGFEVWDEDIFATLTGRDAKVWTEEAVEVFIAPGGKVPDRYYEFQLSPHNVLRDVLVTFSQENKPIPDGSWDCEGVLSAVRIWEDADGRKGLLRWTAEMAIPMKSLVGDSKKGDLGGQVWRANVFRIDRRPRLEYSCWSPTYQENFHVPERFGWLIFR